MGCYGCKYWNYVSPSLRRGILNDHICTATLEYRIRKKCLPEIKARLRNRNRFKKRINRKHGR